MTTVDIPRISRPTRAQFQRDFYLPQRPCIITDAIEDWPARKLWSPEYLKTKVGAVEVRAESIKLSAEGEARFPYWVALGAKFKTAPLGRMVDHIVEQASKPNGEATYLQALNLAYEVPALLPDVKPPDLISPTMPLAANMWFGTGGITPLHFDVQQNLLAVLAGTKEFSLFAPVPIARYYPFPFYSEAAQTSQVDIDRPDFDKFPMFRDAVKHHAVLSPGEMLFIPCFWWHQVRSKPLAMSVNLWYGAGWRFLLNRCGARTAAGLACHIVAGAVRGRSKEAPDETIPAA